MLVISIWTGLSLIGYFSYNKINNDLQKNYDIIKTATVGNITLSCNLNDTSKCFCDNVTLEQFNAKTNLVTSTICLQFFNNLNDDISGINGHTNNMIGIFLAFYVGPTIAIFSAFYVGPTIAIFSWCIPYFVYYAIKYTIIYGLWKYYNLFKKYEINPEQPEIYETNGEVTINSEGIPI